MSALKAGMYAASRAPRLLLQPQTAASGAASAGAVSAAHASCAGCCTSCTCLHACISCAGPCIPSALAASLSPYRSSTTLPHLAAPWLPQALSRQKLPLCWQAC